jgi:anaerobic ribonucleoside-triphosphate reductase activating protein
MGEGGDQKALLDMALYIKEQYQLLVAIYSGRDNVEDYFYKIFNYVKIAPYKKEFGPLNSPTTNQKMFECIDGDIFDITHKFIRKR